MNVVFFNDRRELFLPLVYTRPIAKVRMGILTIEERWDKYFKKKGVEVTYSYLTEEYLSKKFPLIESPENVFINARFFPNNRLVSFILDNLIADEAIINKEDESLIAARCTMEQFKSSSYYIKDYNENFVSIELTTITDFFSKNHLAIEQDFELICAGRQSQEISDTNTVLGERIFLEEGARVEATTLNARTGPIYLGRGTEVMEGCMVRGGFALSEGGTLKMGTKIYGATTIGARSKVGGEINNCVISDYSNKGHDGFMGNSVIGEWCNIGADTNTSNLKNNYSDVKVWSYEIHDMLNSGLQFCGLVMGDHSKCGINTMFNTGTTVGVGSNIFDSGFPPKFIPSFTWNGAESAETHEIKKFFDTAKKVMERREVDLFEEDEKILTAIFDISKKYRE